MYRLVISEKTKDPYGRALEILGSWNPFTKELSVKKDRIEHWQSVGAQMSPTVNNLLIEKEIIKGEKVTASKPGKKSAEEIAAEAKAASEANAKEKPAETPAAEAPAAEVKTE